MGIELTETQAHFNMLGDRILYQRAGGQVQLISNDFVAEYDAESGLIAHQGIQGNLSIFNVLSDGYIDGAIPFVCQDLSTGQIVTSGEIPIHAKKGDLGAPVSGQGMRVVPAAVEYFEGEVMLRSLGR